MKVVASMIVRDEVDVIDECIREISRFTKDIVVLDGGSVDGTIEKIRNYSHVRLEQHFSGDAWDHQAERELLLGYAKEMSPDWIITIDADEIYHSDPISAIKFAEAEGATLISCEIPQFHFSEKELIEGTLQTEDESLPIQERRLFYSWGWKDFMIFKNLPGMTYLGGEEGRITRPPYFPKEEHRIVSRAKPILKHYQFRSLKQWAKKMKARRRSCRDRHKRWFRWTYENPFHNEDILNFFDGRFRDERGTLIPNENWKFL